MKNALSSLIAGSLVVAGAIAAVSAAPPAADANPLRVSLMAATAGAGGFDGVMEVAITNTSRHTVRLPSWQLPSQAPTSKLFQVSVDGEPVDYQGRLAKRGLPAPSDFTILRAGETYRERIDLAGSYDLSRTGQYTVVFDAPLQHASLSNGRMLKHPNGRPMHMGSVPLQLWVDGTDRTAAAAKAGGNSGSGKPCNPNKQDCGGGGGTSPITYVGCSSQQASTAGDAVNAARNYSENSKGYLNAGTVGSRYTTWFGAYTSARYNSVQQNFVAIDQAMDQNSGQIKINCGCNQNYYAYVYPTRPYEIFVCRAFWTAPLTGTDSKAGTLIHEMSHFNVVAGTDDHVYGQTGAQNLAATDPARAVDNADNHEYFAENNPFRN